MFDDDFFDPTEPFSAGEFTMHSNRELDAFDSGCDPDDYFYQACPDCGNAFKIYGSDTSVCCPRCGGRFRV